MEFSFGPSEANPPGGSWGGGGVVPRKERHMKARENKLLWRRQMTSNNLIYLQFTRFLSRSVGCHEIATRGPEFPPGRSHKHLRANQAQQVLGGQNIGRLCLLA